MTRDAAIRLARATDAPGVAALGRTMIEHDQGLVTTADDLLEQSVFCERFTGRCVDSTRREYVAVSAASSVIGHATIARFGPSLLRHVATLSVAVHPLYQRRGIGRALMQSLIDSAPCVCVGNRLRLELYVRADNRRAQALYASLGFEHEATRRQFVRTPDGRFVDDWIMTRFLDVDAPNQ